jgi:hypothetical protein
MPWRWAGDKPSAAGLGASERANESSGCWIRAPSSRRALRDLAPPGVQDRTPADGKVSGYGRIDGRPVAVVSNDFTVMGASSRW